MRCRWLARAGSAVGRLGGSRLADCSLAGGGAGGLGLAVGWQDWPLRPPSCKELSQHNPSWLGSGLCKSPFAGVSLVWNKMTVRDRSDAGLGVQGWSKMRLITGE